MPTIEWHILIKKDLQITERVCWRGWTPEVIEPEMPSGLPFTKRINANNANNAINASDATPLEAGISARDAKDKCIDLAIDLDAMARALHDETAVTRLEDDKDYAVYGSFDPWLWHPRPWPKKMSGRLFVKVDPAFVGGNFSFPHSPVPSSSSSSVVAGDDESNEYVIPYSTWSFMARFAMGRFVVDHREVAGARFSIVRLPGATTHDRLLPNLKFVDVAAAAVASVDSPPKMPTSRIQVLLRSGSGRRGGSDPVQFGMAMRGGGASVALLISPTASEEQLYGEWIATHELSHLWLPPVDREGVWLSEGLASYYQCILRSRVGIYDEARGWDELVSGFERGRAQAGNLPLNEARRPRFQHIYWGGAAIALKLDVMLRKHGSESLDAAVASVRRSMDDSEDRPAEEMLRLLARRSGLDLVTPVRAWLEQPFPDTSEELRDLGITQRSAGEVIVLSDQAPLASTRKAMAGRR